MSKPNILFIAPVRQYCGWGSASKDYARALSTIGNVTVRNIFLSNQREKKLPPDIKILEDTTYDKYDIIVQKALPNFYYYDGRFTQNIGMMVFETEIDNHSWFNNMNLMDKILVPSYLEKRWLDRKVKTKVFNISEAIDTTVGNKEYQSLNDVMKDKNIFKFLFIGEAIPRKGIRELLQAYFQEFSINDNVLLIIKTNADIFQEINNTRANMRRFASDTKYPPVFLIHNRISEDQINSLHQDSDVLVMPSYGESFNRPVAKSLCFNKPVIATNGTGMMDYLDKDLGWILESSREQVFCMQPPLPDLYTSREIYYVPNILDLRSCMREAYKKPDLYKQLSANIKKSNIVSKFSYETVGKNILEAINK